MGIREKLEHATHIRLFGQTGTRHTPKGKLLPIRRIDWDAELVFFTFKGEEAQASFGSINTLDTLHRKLGRRK